MDRGVKEGDKIVVTKFSGSELDVPHIATVADVLRIPGVFILEEAINGSDVIFKSVPDCDVWIPMSDWEAGNREVEVGDKITVSKYNDDLCQREAIVTDVNTITIDVRFCDSGELAVIYKYHSGLDEWHFADEDITLDASSYDEEEAVVLNRDVKVGDSIAVTRVNFEELERVHFAEVTGVYDDFDGGIDIEPKINGEDVLYIDQDDGDVWRILSENPQYDEDPSPSKSVADKTLEDVKVVYSDANGVKLCDRGELAVLYKDSSGLDEWDYASEDSLKHHEEEALQHRQAHAYYDDEALSPSYSDAVKAGMTFADYTGAHITEESLDFEPKEVEVLRGITAGSLNFEEAPKSDAVNHPSHYNYGDIEVIDFIEQVTEQYEDGFDAYIVGNALKYLARSPHKNGLEDVKKAVWYLERLIRRNEVE